jgi:hypothetical protein
MEPPHFRLVHPVRGLAICQAECSTFANATLLFRCPQRFHQLLEIRALAQRVEVGDLGPVGGVLPAGLDGMAQQLYPLVRVYVLLFGASDYCCLSKPQKRFANSLDTS